MSLRPPLRSLLFALAGLAAISAAYANHFHNSFHFDDIHTIVDNPAIRSLRRIPAFFTDATAFSVLPPNRTYRPILSTTLAFDYRLGIYDPFWYHVASFSLFVLQLVLMYALFTALLQSASPLSVGRNKLVAFVATAWYGLHPAMAETVNYIIQRGDILSTLGVVAALTTYIRWPPGRRWGLYLIPLVLGLLSKPPAMVFPALLLAYLLLFPQRDEQDWRSAASAVLPSVAVTAAVMLVEARMTPPSFVASSVPYSSYVLTQPYVVMHYVLSLFAPLHLNVDTDLEPFHHLDARAFAGIAFCAALLSLIFLAWKPMLPARRSAPAVSASQHRAPIVFGLLWFVAGLLPTSLYRLAEVENDHRMYLPFVGLVLAVTCALALAVESLASRPAPHHARGVRLTAGAIAAAALTACAFGTHRRNQVWRTEETLWLDDVQKSPHNGRGLMIYGLTQMEKGDLPRALAYFERAERYTPNYATLEINLGVVHGSLGNAAEAEQHFLRAMSLAPRDDQPHLFYGRWLLDQARLPEAISQERTALLLNPARVEPHDLLAQAYAEQGDSGLARASATEALALDPHDAKARALLAGTAPLTPELWLTRSLQDYRAGRYAESIVAARHAIELRPNYAEAWNNVGAGYAALGVWDEAIRADEQALRIQPGLTLAQNNLAWARRRKNRHP